MKQKGLMFLTFIAFLLCSCEDKPSSYTPIKGIENLIYLSIQEFRTNHGKDGPFVHQFIMVREAQIYSYKMANDAAPLDPTGLAEHWDEIHGKIGGYNDQSLVMRTQSSNENEILTQLLQLPGADSVLLEDVTQCGIGMESDADGNNLLTVMLMKVDS